MATKDLTKKYSESFDDFSDAKKQRIRKELLGLNKKGEKIENKDSELYKLLDASFLGGKVAEQDAFRGLAADLLQTTVDRLKEQKAKETEFEMFRGLSGFDEIAGMGGSLSNSILAEIGGVAGMAGVGGEALKKDNLEESINNMAGLGFLQGAQYDWQKWFDGELSKRYENMKEVKGLAEAEQTYKLEKQFMDSFINDYIKPRFDYSRSIDEFISYIDVKQDEENILQTETTLKEYKNLINKQTQKFYQDLKQKKVGFDPDFYANPLSAFSLKQGRGVDYKGISRSKQAKYQNQREKFEKDWEEAKRNPKKKREFLGGKSWKQYAVQLGYDLNNKKDFARLHYNAIGTKEDFDGAKDIINKSDIEDFINEQVMPGIAQTDLKFGNKPFREFVSPEKYADDLLGDYNIGTEEYEKALKDLGISTKGLSIDEVRDELILGLRSTGADTIRESIKYYNEKKKKPSQKLLGVSYIEREEDYDKDAIDEDSNAIYKMFVKGGYEGSEDEFFNEFMPDADKEDMKLLSKGLSGNIGTMFDDLDTSDPFAALGSVGGLLGEEPEDMFGDKTIKSSSKDKESSYFDVFGDKEKEYEDYTNKYSGLGGYSGFGSFNFF
tara:strand:- start:2154 stop:3980 length:1827 start_codon:yes stop_codon:yes gene_type:complete